MTTVLGATRPCECGHGRYDHDLQPDVPRCLRCGGKSALHVFRAVTS